MVSFFCEAYAKQVEDLIASIRKQDDTLSRMRKVGRVHTVYRTVRTQLSQASAQNETDKEAVSDSYKIFIQVSIQPAINYFDTALDMCVCISFSWIVFNSARKSSSSVLTLPRLKDISTL